MCKLLQHNGIPDKIVTIIRNSYKGLNFKVEHGGQLTEAFQVRTGVTDVLLSHTHKQGGSDADIKPRTGKARTSFIQLLNIWRSKDLSVKTKVRIFNTNVQGSSFVRSRNLENYSCHH